MARDSVSPTRRSFLKMAWGTVTVMVTPVAATGWQRDPEPASLAGGGPGRWSGGQGQARFRIDGLAKVTGRKIYARDFRARDMGGWPASERVAMVLRATYADRRLRDVDLSMLPRELQPVTLVDAERLRRDNVGDLSADASPAGDGQDSWRFQANCHCISANPSRS